MIPSRTSPQFTNHRGVVVSAAVALLSSSLMGSHGLGAQNTITSVRVLTCADNYGMGKTTLGLVLPEQVKMYRDDIVGRLSDIFREHRAIKSEAIAHAVDAFGEAHVVHVDFSTYSRDTPDKHQWYKALVAEALAYTLYPTNAMAYGRFYNVMIACSGLKGMVHVANSIPGVRALLFMFDEVQVVGSIASGVQDLAGLYDLWTWTRSAVVAGSMIYLCGKGALLELLGYGLLEGSHSSPTGVQGVLLPAFTEANLNDLVGHYAIDFSTPELRGDFMLRLLRFTAGFARITVYVLQLGADRRFESSADVATFFQGLLGRLKEDDSRSSALKLMDSVDRCRGSAPLRKLFAALVALAAFHVPVNPELLVPWPAELSGENRAPVKVRFRVLTSAVGAQLRRLVRPPDEVEDDGGINGARYEVCFPQFMLHNRPAAEEETVKQLVGASVLLASADDSVDKGEYFEQWFIDWCNARWISPLVRTKAVGDVFPFLSQCAGADELLYGRRCAVLRYDQLPMITRKATVAGHLPDDLYHELANFHGDLLIKAAPRSSSADAYVKLQDGSFLAFVLRNRKAKATPGEIREEYLKALGLAKNATLDYSDVKEFKQTTVVVLWNQPLPECATGQTECRVWEAGASFDQSLVIRPRTRLVVAQLEAVQQLFLIG